ncbi:MAG: hypothetical protein HY094_05790 [Candidatus Melainabacteria bacterium]|nr:hypothetical protein [Candidatus Melainabacteria bacterium]
MKISNIKNILVKALILVCCLFFHPLNSQAMDPGYDGDKPLFVTITTDWCFACKYLEPTVEELKREYGGQITFVKLDASSEQSISQAQLIAQSYGIAEFFNNNRNAFPRVAIYCPGGLSPTKNLLGANKIENYRGILDDLLLNQNKICNIDGRPPSSADSGQDRPNEPKQTEVIVGRPDEPSLLLDRPKEALASGRPPELTFWTIGQPIPYYAYYQYLSLPKCSGTNQIICSNQTDTYAGSNQPVQGPVFKPWDPNATRNEKGFNAVVKKG